MNNLFHIDRLEKNDYYRGFLQLLEQLTTVNATEITYDEFCNRVDNINSEVYVIRNLTTNKVVATGSIMIERKFIHKLSAVGHIEDIVVDNEYRSLGLGKELINCLIKRAQEHNCYKIVLNCADKNIKFYEKCGFVIKEFGMAKYF